MCSHYVGAPRYALLLDKKARAWSDKNLTKCTAVVRGDEAYL